MSNFINNNNHSKINQQIVIDRNICQYKNQLKSLFDKICHEIIKYNVTKNITKYNTMNGGENYEYFTKIISYQTFNGLV